MLAYRFIFVSIKGNLLFALVNRAQLWSLKKQELLNEGNLFTMTSKMGTEQEQLCLPLHIVCVIDSPPLAPSQFTIRLAIGKWRLAIADWPG